MHSERESEMGKQPMKKLGNGASGKFCMSYSTWRRRRQYEVSKWIEGDKNDHAVGRCSQRILVVSL